MSYNDDPYIAEARAMGAEGTYGTKTIQLTLTVKPTELKVDDIFILEGEEMPMPSVRILETRLESPNTMWVKDTRGQSGLMKDRDYPDGIVISRPVSTEGNFGHGGVMPKCPACREFIDYCQGHGEIADPTGAAILKAHDEGDHSLCAIRCES